MFSHGRLLHGNLRPPSIVPLVAGFFADSAPNSSADIHTGKSTPSSQALSRTVLARGLLIGCCLVLIFALSCLRFTSLNADFPNWSEWMIDQAKFTDEGWWASGAVNYFLLGHWNLPGDYNPAAALPVWPFLLGLVFRFTGVSIVAARALSVSLSIVTMGIVYTLVRRKSGIKSSFPALFAALLLASSPFAYAFSRLAILESLIIFEFCLALLVATYLTSPFTAKSFGILGALGLLIACMILTKTTGVLLVPALGWVAWRMMGGKIPALLLSLVTLCAVPAGICKGYAIVVANLGFGADYKYFFDVNAMEDVDWTRAWETCVGVIQHGFWVDRVLFPVALAVLVLSVVWMRRLWQNPLYTACWIAIAAEAAFVFRTGEDYAPRYFLVMLAPMVLIIVLAYAGLKERAPKAAALLAFAMAVAVATNFFTTIGFATHRSYGLQNAASAIKNTVRADATQQPMIFGVSASQVSLMTGIPSINDAYGLEDMSQKVAIYRPGWYLVWNSVSDSNTGLLAPFRLEEAGTYPVFDDDDRNKLVLFKMIARPVAGQPHD